MKDIFVGNNANMENPEDFGQECYNNFMTELGDDITGSCMIPMNLPLKQVKNIVKIEDDNDILVKIVIIKEVLSNIKKDEEIKLDVNSIEGKITQSIVEQFTRKFKEDLLDFYKELKKEINKIDLSTIEKKAKEDKKSIIREVNGLSKNI